MVTWPQKHSKSMVVFLCLSVVLVFFLFKSAFSAYFFQDDWFSLSISQARSPAEFFKLFFPVNGVIYYRPLGMQIPFFISQTLFGLTPLPFRVATFTVHLLNSWLVYRLLKKIVGNLPFAYAGAFLYATSATQMIIFYWAATFAFVLAPLFYLQSVLNFLDKKGWWSWTWFVIGLLVNELLITLPAMITVYAFRKGKSEMQKTLKFWIIAVVYFIFRLKVASFSTGEGYSLLTSLQQIFLNLRNYLLWVLNWPDEIANQFMSFTQLNPEFMQGFSKYVYIWVFETILIALCFTVIPLIAAAKNRLIKPELKLVGFGLFWFIATLSPVLFFSKHFFSYYLPIPLIGLLIIFGVLWKQIRATSLTRYAFPLLVIICGVWYWAAVSTMEFNMHIHWSIRRANRSYTLVSKLLDEYPHLPETAVVLIPPRSDEENMWALGESNAIQVLYNNPDLETFFGSRSEYLADFPNSHRQLFVLP